LLSGSSALFSFTNVVHLFANELSRLRAGRFSLRCIFPSFSGRFFVGDIVWHSCLPAFPIDESAFVAAGGSFRASYESLDLSAASLLVLLFSIQHQAASSLFERHHDLCFGVFPLSVEMRPAADEGT